MGREGPSTGLETPVVPEGPRGAVECSEPPSLVHDDPCPSHTELRHAGFTQRTVPVSDGRDPLPAGLAFASRSWVTVLAVCVSRGLR